MPTLWKLHLSRKVSGFASGPVRSVEAALCGRLCAETGKIVTPDPNAIVQCLPHYYRKAFDRGGNMWHPKEDDGASYVTLYDRKGKYLNTIYAFPYVFNAGKVAA